MRTVDKVRAAKCPKTYLTWSFVVAGMIVAFFGYLVVSNVTNDVSDSGVEGVDETSGSLSGAARNLILTEHINETDDYEKPVCKRLEESGERY